MEFALSDIQTMLLDSAERLLGADAGVEYWREQRHSDQGFDRARWAQFAELGWLALPIPEKAGGLGGTMEDIALLNIALGRALATEPYASTAVLAPWIIEKGLPEDRAASELEAIGSGARLWALADGEPGVGPGAVARPNGTGYHLTGTKFLALDAPSADRLIVTARIEGEEGAALFAVDARAEGVAVESYPLVDGTRAADIALKDVWVGADDLLAGGNSGSALLAEAIGRASIALMAQAVGSMEACLEICGDYVRERRQFGVPIGSFQAIQHIMADMFVASHQARSILYHAISHIDDEPAERAAASSAARIVIGEASQAVSRAGIQVHGGYGLTDEYAISHHFRRLLVLEKLYGDSADHMKRLGDAIFES
jgi:alkylation response protein AidB-like acyl-CoA dehydrogenase